MRLATVAQSQEIDSLSAKVYGLSAEILMEAAGVSAVREIQLNFYPELSRGMTAVLCGPGHNGADGLVVARHLHSLGFRDLVVLVAAPVKKRSPLYKKQIERAELAGLRIVDILKQPKKVDQLESAVLVVDALFGIGFKKGLKDEYLGLIEKLNSLKAPIVSLDCPSGFDCDTGVVQEASVRAHTTLTFGLAKPGFFVADGPATVGKLRVLPIGFPYECLRGVATTHFLFNEKLARRYLPTRKDRSNKSDFGKLVVFAGQPNMWGAGILASQSAYRIGTGYVVWAGKEVPFEKLPESPEILLAKMDDPQLWDKAKVTAYAVGPGFGVDDQTAEVLRKLKSMKAECVVVDADGINAAVKYGLFPFPKSWVITPHTGELARILGGDARELEKDRFKAALLAAKKTNCHVLVKGFRSVLAYEDRVMVINSGNAALAKAGTGDVLTGMVGGLLAQGLDPLQATATAAYIHGRLADEWVRAGADKRTLLASDLKEGLSMLLNRISHSTIF